MTIITMTAAMNCVGPRYFRILDLLSMSAGFRRSLSVPARLRRVRKRLRSAASGLMHGNECAREAGPISDLPRAKSLPGSHCCNGWAAIIIRAVGKDYKRFHRGNPGSKLPA
jgi:hypothetical protein